MATDADWRRALTPDASPAALHAFVRLAVAVSVRHGWVVDGTRTVFSARSPTRAVAIHYFTPEEVEYGDIVFSYLINESDGIPELVVVYLCVPFVAERAFALVLEWCMDGILPGAQPEPMRWGFNGFQ